MDKLGLRWFGLAVVLAAEIVWGINALTVPDLSGQSGLAAAIVRSAAQLFKVGIAFSATFLLILSRQRRQIAEEFRQQTGYRWRPWLAGHGIGLIAFLGLSWPVLGPSPEVPDVSGQWLTASIAAGIVAVASLLLAAAPAGAWLRLVRRERVGAAVAVVAGCVAWLGGFLAQSVWLPLAQMTFWCTRLLLSLIYADVYYDMEKTLVGANDFAVQIAPVCSGYEGMALIAVFVTVYLWLFRADLRFPGALLLLPVGVIVIWLANVWRISTLVAIGASMSPEIAVTGFHSQAGWITFSIVALGTIALSHRLWLSAPASELITLPMDDPGLAVALLAPLLTSLAVLMLVTAFSSGFAALYPLGVFATAAVLWRYRGHYQAFSRDVRWQAIGIGVAVFVLWLILVPPNDESGALLAGRLAEMPAGLAAAWVFFRVIGSVITVPLAEELAFRGYLIRKLVAKDFENVQSGHFTWISFLVSSLLFGLLHDNWLAGTLAGAGFAMALYQRGKICDAIVAHMTSNALIAVAVLGFGRWSLWS